MREAIEKVIAEMMETCETIEKEGRTTARKSGPRAAMQNMICAGSEEALKWSISKLREVLAGDPNPKSNEHAADTK